MLSTKLFKKKNKIGKYKDKNFWNFPDILVPAKLPDYFDCGSCPKKIFLHNEVDGKLHYDAKGNPVCVLCRIKGSTKDKVGMARGKEDFDKDQKELYTFRQRKANQQAQEVAIVSQLANKSVMKNNYDKKSN